MQEIVKPKLSVLCITYNHRNFIVQAIESVMTQETNFPFEFIIGDDGSTDGTREIIEEYARKYPKIIRPIYHDQNTGGYQNYADVYNAALGQYIIMNEGDDFFTDKQKLQKQVDYLDFHPEHSICFHPVKVFWEDKSAKDYIYPSKKIIKKYKDNFCYDTLKEYNYIQTNSCMYRKDDKSFEYIIPKNILPCDWYFHLYYSRLGKIGFIDIPMAAYRRHASGIWSMIDKDKEGHILKYGLLTVNFYYQASKRFSDDSEFWLKHAVRLYDEVARIFLKHRAWDKIDSLRKMFPELSEKNLGYDETEYFKTKYKFYRKLFYISVSTSIVILLLFIAEIFMK